MTGSASRDRPLPPGEGGPPLAELVAAAPPEAVVSAEAPMAETGESAAARAARLHRSTAGLLAAGRRG